MSLLSQQHAFGHLILAKNDADAADIKSTISETAHKGMQVYRHAYRMGLLEALRETYENTWAWLGDDAFEKAALDYIQAHPSQSWTLANYGSQFANFLSTLYPDDPEIYDLARLEWALRCAFDGPDTAPIDPAALGDLDWDRAVLTFVPTMQILPVRTNCGALWVALEQEQIPPDAALLPVPAALCVWRKQLSPQFRTLDGQELLALQTAQTGASFGNLCTLLSGGKNTPSADISAEIGAILGRWLHDEMLAQIIAKP